MSEGWNEWEQDPDTLDTWFSSALWTWSTLIDPALAEDYSLTLEDLLAGSPDFQAYHPTNVLETGWDILFFWVARMILSTTYATGQIPFKTVYLHGLIKGEDGKKMSKSRPETLIDPLSVIPKYGTDALRMALIMGVSPGNDQNWGWGKIEANRNFCNKLWNIARYCEMALDENYVHGSTPEPQTVADHWVLRKLLQSSDQISDYLDTYRFSEAYDLLYHFVWDDIADWYIEASKSQTSREVLGYVLENILKLAHPFAPFVTETIWQTLYRDSDSLLISSSWPNVVKADSQQADDFEQIKAIVAEARSLVKLLGLAKPSLYYTGVPFLTENGPLLARLAGLGGVSEVSSGTGLQLTGTGYSCWLDVDSSTLKAYSDKLAEQLSAQERVIVQLRGRLQNKSYVAHAPEQIVAETRAQLHEAETTLERLTSEAHRFAG
jgi:valyl-tRNA synthetase